jgi:riboflavin biosynthesis pyrimidine reductase
VEPLELLVERAGLPSFPLPEALGRAYPGTLGFPADCLYANFVETLDGVVALPGVSGSNRLIADASEADHFVMALLRACADVVLVGAGTLRASPSAAWTPAAAFPPLADTFAELRRELGLSPEPAIAVVTRGTALPVPAERLRRQPIVLTTGGEPELADLGPAIDALRARGYRRILSEGGPTLFGSLLSAGLVDELFLTLSPLVAGRSSVAERALSLVESVELLPERRVAASLRGVRRSGEHLFLRYALER